MSLMLKRCIFARSLMLSSFYGKLKTKTNVRMLTLSTVKLQDKIQPSPPTETVSKGSSVLQHGYTPTNLDKKMLVWTKKYKTTDDVPTLVSREEMEKCRSRMRIRVSNILMVLTLVGCIIMVRSGKQAAERGETLTKMNQDFHKQYNEAKK